MAMMTEEARHELHEALRSKIGPTPAGTLMSSLPPVGWADVATKHDIAELELRLELSFEKRFAEFQRSLIFILLASQATLVGAVLAAAKL